MTDITGSPVLIIGQTIDNHSNTIGAVAFIDDGFIIVFVAFTSRFLDDTFDVVVGDVIGLCLCNQITQFGIAGRVCTAFLNANGDFPSDFGEDFSLSGICRFFFSFDIIPF